MPRPVAPQLAALVERLLGAPLPVAIRAWDGSEAGPAAAAPVVVLRHRRALRRLLWSPGELGLARAFVAGELDVEGDLADGLSRFWRVARARGLTGGRRSPTLARDALALAAAARRARPAAGAAGVGGAARAAACTAAAATAPPSRTTTTCPTTSTRFLLDPRMAYSCGYWTQRPARATASPTPSAPSST